MKISFSKALHRSHKFSFHSISASPQPHSVPAVNALVVPSASRVGGSTFPRLFGSQSKKLGHGTEEEKKFYTKMETAEEIHKRMSIFSFKKALDVARQALIGTEDTVEGLLGLNTVEKKPLAKHFKYEPTKDMTGVETSQTRLCATISAQLYKTGPSGTVKTTGDFKLSAQGEASAEAIIFDDHGDLEPTNPPFVVVVTGKTMILSWRGSKTSMDWINDFAFSPQSNPSWSHIAKSVRAHGAYSAIVQNDMALHGPDVIREIESRGITELILTGHSLGGSLAQTAHLVIEGELQREGSEWSALKGVIDVRALNFEGPMAIVVVDGGNPEAENFVNKIAKNTATFVFSQDPVPRCYGDITFLNDMMDDCLDEVETGKRIPDALLSIFNLRRIIEHEIEKALHSKKMVGLINVATKYRHLGNVIYYESPEAHPIVLKDMGTNYNKTSEDGMILRDITYKKINSHDIMNDIKTDHMYIVQGPGLAYDSDKLR